MKTENILLGLIVILALGSCQLSNRGFNRQRYTNLRKIKVEVIEEIDVNESYSYNYSESLESETIESTQTQETEETAADNAVNGDRSIQSADIFDTEKMLPSDPVLARIQTAIDNGETILVNLRGNQYQLENPKIEGSTLKGDLKIIEKNITNALLVEADIYVREGDHVEIGSENIISMDYVNAEAGEVSQDQLDPRGERPDRLKENDKLIHIVWGGYVFAGICAIVGLFALASFSFEVIALPLFIIGGLVYVGSWLAAWRMHINYVRSDREDRLSKDKARQFLVWEVITRGILMAIFLGFIGLAYIL